MPNNLPHNMLSAYIAAAVARGEPVFVEIPVQPKRTPEMTLPSHLFVSSTDGGLYDCRIADWHQLPALRAPFSRHFTRIRTVAEFKACLRAGQSTDLGGYPLYFITSDGAAISFEGARANLRSIMDSIQTSASDGWRVVACEINCEDTELLCDATGKPIACAYGDADAAAQNDLNVSKA